MTEPTKYTTVVVSVQQAAALRAMLKMEAVARMSERLRNAELTEGDALQRHQSMLQGILGAVDTWSALDRPFAIALEQLDDQHVASGLDVNLEETLSVPVYTDALQLYHVVVSDGLYNTAVEQAKKGSLAKEYVLPIVLMDRNKEALLNVFTGGTTVVEDKTTVYPTAFPVRGGGMLN